MSWSKRQLAAEALGEIGIASYEFDITPDEQQMVIRRLDSMMATWESAWSIRLGYKFPSTADGSDPDDDSGLPDGANETVFLNLAIRVASAFGKQLSADTRANARQGWDALLEGATFPIEQQLPNTLPRGAGAKFWRSFDQPFFPAPDSDPLSIGAGGDLDIL